MRGHNIYHLTLMMRRQIQSDFSNIYNGMCVDFVLCVCVCMFVYEYLVCIYVYVGSVGLFLYLYQCMLCVSNHTYITFLFP
ncbi:hypothetical protein EON63_14490 [archaeon]|nr:MAG: hypothetical protein EON63_14490 [archaeon]